MLSISIRMGGCLGYSVNLIDGFLLTPNKSLYRLFLFGEKSRKIDFFQSRAERG